MTDNQATGATTELYYRTALRALRTRTKQAERTDPVLDLFARRPYTEDEIETEAQEMLAKFRAILAARADLEPYLALGCDLIEELSR